MKDWTEGVEDLAPRLAAAVTGDALKKINLSAARARKRKQPLQPRCHRAVVVTDMDVLTTPNWKLPYLTGIFIEGDDGHAANIGQEDQFGADGEDEGWGADWGKCWGMRAMGTRTRASVSQGPVCTPSLSQRLWVSTCCPCQPRLKSDRCA